MAMTQPTATVTIDGTTFEYGCPDYPCPVTALVKDHADRGKFFWMEPSPFPVPAIYLIVLSTPVKLRAEPVLPPPPPPFLKLAPALNGPDELMGERMGPNQELVCRNINLAIESMDGRDWMFISAGRTIRLLDWDWGTDSWVATATATSMQSYVNHAEWSQLERGYYGLHPGVASTTYDATFDVIVETGNEGERETISHTLRCTDPVPPEPPEPLKPYLTGPEMVRGEWQKGGHWWWPTYRLTCSDLDLELVSPDGGPWALVPNGELEIKYLNWDSFRKQWEHHPIYWWPTTINFGVSDWNMMLAHDYTIVPPITEHSKSLDGYKGMVTVTVIRTVGSTDYEHTLRHDFKCVAPDLYDHLNR
jgi:hypothetical protein